MISSIFLSLLVLKASFSGITSTTTSPAVDGNDENNSTRQNSTKTYRVYETERDLHEHLFMKYNNDVIPRMTENGHSLIYFFFSLLKLASFDIKEQVLTVVGIVTMNWYDDQLIWENTEKFNFIDSISVDRKKIWTPDIVLYNSADISGKSHLDIYTSRPIVSYDGYVDWNAPVQLKVSCSSDITWFPIDKQVCEMIFGSWSYNRNILRVKKYDKRDMQFNSKVFQVESGEWHIKSVAIKIQNVTLDCCVEDFSAIVFTISLERMSLFYFLYIILPLVALAFLFLFVFHIPFDSGERTGFGVTVLLSITVYLLVISEKLPEKSDGLPLLGICFVFIFFLLCSALLIAIFTMHSPNFISKPPKFLTTILNYRLMKHTQNFENQKQLFDTAGNKTSPKNDGFEQETEFEHGYPIATGNKKLDYSLENSYNNHGNNKVKKTDIESGYQLTENNDFSEDWKSISRKIEKLFFVIFAVLLVLVPCVIVFILKNI